jgi:hypothetical protein
MAVDSEDAASLVILRLWRMRLSQDPQSHFSPETATLWCGLKSIGDGYLCGHHMQPQRNVGRYRSHIMPSYSPSEGTSVVNTKIGIMLGSSLGQDDAKLSRMETLKQLFHAFVNRASAYDFPCQLGLVSFGSSVEQLGEISSVFTDFLEHSDSLEPKGDTKLFDAIHFGVQKLVEFRDAQVAAGKPAPERLRLICISDGDDNGSDISPLEAAIALQPATPIDVVFDALGAIFDMEVETRWKCTVCIANGDDRGRLRKAKRPRNRCNNCEKRGCDYSCPVKKHDFDLCTSCWEKIAGPLAVAILHSVQQQFSG